MTMKKNLAVLIAAIMCFSVLGLTPKQVHADTTPDEIYVAGLNVAAGTDDVTYYKKASKSGSATEYELTTNGASADNYNVKYQKSTHTLTLKNLDLSGVVFSSNKNNNIEIKSTNDVTVLLDGTNSLNGKSGGVLKKYGIFTQNTSSGVGDVIIDNVSDENPGYLNISVAGSPATGIIIQGNDSSKPNLTISGGTIDIVMSATKGPTPSYALMSKYGNLTINDDANININISSADSDNVTTGLYAEEEEGSLAINDNARVLLKMVSENKVRITNVDPTLGKTMRAVYSTDANGTSATVWEGEKNILTAVGNKYFKVEPYYFTVTYTDGVGGEAFEDQINTEIQLGEATPPFKGKPTREGYKFVGWNPDVAQTVTESVKYTA